MKWPIRELLNPVVTRSLLYGVNPFDLEYVLKKVDKIEKMSGREIQSVWLGEWDKKIKKYLAVINIFVFVFRYSNYLSFI